MVQPVPAQPPDPSVNAALTQYPYSYPIMLDQRLLAYSESTLSQAYPPHFGSTLSGPMTCITPMPYFPTATLAHGNNYISVLNIESPTGPHQSKKRKRVGGTGASRKRKGKPITVAQGNTLIYFTYTFLSASGLSKASSDLTEMAGEKTQHLDSAPCGVGPSASETQDLPEGLEHINKILSPHSLSAFSVSPADFHAQHFGKSSE